MSPKNFLETLFDFSFTSFITTKLVKILYGLFIAIAGLMSIFIVLGALYNGILQGFFALVIVAPIFFSLTVIYARVMMEVIVVFFRISEQMAVVANHFVPEGSSTQAPAPSTPPISPTTTVG